MTPAETAAILRQFNEWRRDFDDRIEQPDSRDIGEAIDAAVEMIDRLEAAEKERDNANAAAAGVALHAGAMQAQLEMVENDRDDLRAHIEQMEQQEPVRHEFQGRDGKWYPFIDERHYETTLADGSWAIRPLYALHGAKGE